MSMLDENPCLIQDSVDFRYRRAPLVLIHDGGGTTFSYHCLGDIERPLYGIANPHYGTDKTCAGGLPEIAQYYVKLIKCVIAGGNLIIGGWSFGGLVSLEMASILARDKTFNLLGIIMIDSACPNALKNTTATVAEQSLQWNDWTSQETRDSVARCFSESAEAVQKWTLPVWGDDAKGSCRAADAITRKSALRPPPVMLLKAKDSVPVEGVAGVSRVDVSRTDRILGWGMYREDLITQVVEIPGHHFTIFAADENLEAVTGKIRNACMMLEVMATGKGTFDM